jgi:hypothetical protein
MAGAGLDARRHHHVRAGVMAAVARTAPGQMR